MSKKQIEQIVLTASVLTFLSLPVYAATADTDSATNEAATSAKQSQKVVHIEPISVTAAGFSQLVKDAPADITVISKEEIARKGYTDFAGLLSDVEGVDVRASTGRMGAAGVSIRGMDEKYTLIMVDGVPVNGASSQDIGPNGFYQQVYSFIPPANSIERIEVVKGPMSTLYGSDAMGGAINIITKKITNEVHGNISVDHTFETDKGRGDTNRISGSIRGPIQADKVGLELRGSYIFRQASTDENGDVVRGGMRTPSKLKNSSLGGKLVWTPTQDNTYSLDLDFSRVDQSMNGTANMGYRFDREKVVFGAENIKSYGIWNTTLSYNSTVMHGYSLNQYDPSAGERTMKDSNYIGETKLEVIKWKDHHANFGLRFWHEELDDALLKTGGRYGKTITPKLGVLENDTWALFAEDTWSLTPKLDFTYGVRYEHPDKFEDHFTPRGYLVYKANDTWTVKGGVSTGFRVPTLAQVQNGIVSYSGGYQTGHIISVYGNPNLKPEKSVNKEIGVYYSDPSGLRGNITVFDTTYKNKITTEELDAYSNIYQNIDGGKAHGVEMGIRVPLSATVHFNANYTYTSSKITSGESEGYPLTATPKHMVNAKVDWDVNDRANVWFGMEYRKGMARYTSNADNRVVSALGLYYKPYSVFYLGGSYKFDHGLTLTAQINNIFDKDFDKTAWVNGTEYNLYYSAGKSTNGTYLSGRNYWVSLSYNF